MNRIIMTLALTLLALSPAMAHEEESLGEITGKGVSVFYQNHALSGQIAENLVYARPFEKEFGIQVLHRFQGKEIESSLKSVNGKIVGNFSIPNESGEAKNVAFQMLSANAKEGTFEGKLGEENFKVKITSQKIEEGHFVDPHFEATIGTRTYAFDLKNGKACMGCAVKISYVVLSMLHAHGQL